MTREYVVHACNYGMWELYNTVSLVEPCNYMMLLITFLLTLFS